MNNTWKQTSLEDFAYYVKDRISSSLLDNDQYISTENMLPNKTGIVSAASIPSQTNVTKVSKGDVLISNIRPYFKKIWFANYDCGCSNDVLCLRSTSVCLPKYLYYLLSSDSFFDYVMSGAKGTKMPRGDKQQILRYSVALPNKNLQQQIIDILSSLDDKIEINTAINQNLDRIAA